MGDELDTTRLVELSLSSILSALVGWLYASTQKASKRDVQEYIQRLEADITGLRGDMKEYVTKAELQAQMSAIQQSLADLRVLIKAALDKKSE